MKDKKTGSLLMMNSSIYIWYRNILKKLHSNKFFLLILDFALFLKRKITTKKIDETLLTNIEWITEYNIPINWFYWKKKNGISWVARLKNAEHFLEKCMESYVQYLDELILVDNMSTDRTQEICKKLQKKYPDKIKYYQYPHQVCPPGKENANVPSNSIHSLAYYYNRSFSKTKYSHVVKVDDDNLMITEKWKVICSESKNKFKNRYNIYWWLNITTDDNWNFCIMKWEEYSGLFWDHWVYPVSPYTYYVQRERRESLNHNLYVRRCWFSFLHLKFLKPNYWLHNLLEHNKKGIIKNLEKLDYIYDYEKFIGNEKKINLDKYLELIK